MRERRRGKTSWRNGRMGMGAFGGAGFGLVRIDQIQKELQLTDEQKLKLLGMVKELRGGEEGETWNNNSPKSSSPNSLNG